MPKFPRPKLSYILPVILLIIGMVIFSRSIALFHDMSNLVSGRKQFDAEIVNRLVSMASASAVTDRQDQLVLMDGLLRNTHRSTRVIISDEAGDRLVDNVPTLDPGIVPDDAVEIAFDRWRSQDPHLFVDGVNFSLRGDEYHSVARIFYQNVEQHTEKRFTILITNLDESIEKYYFPSVINLIFTGLLIASGVCVAILSVILPLRKMEKLIGNGKSVSIGCWWPVEIAKLARKYNQFICDQEAANKQLLESIELANKVINGLPDTLVFVKGIDRKYLLANQGMVDLVGYPIIGLTDVDIWPNNAPEYNRNDDEAIEHGSQVNKLEPITKNGKKGWLNTSKIVLHINGQPAVLGVCVDVTELVETKNTIEQMYRSLRHDIISNVKGICDMVQLLEMSGFVPEDDYVEIFSILKNKTETAYKLVSNTGKLGEALCIESTSIFGILESTKDIYVTENIIIKYPENDFNIRVDKNAFILKVLSNLITNAIKYSPRNSEVELGCKIKPNSSIIYVKDAGGGLDERDISTIFDNYGSSARLNTVVDGIIVEGSGTGIHTVRHYLNLMGLELKVKSRKGSGSIFFIEVPKNDY